MNSRNEHSNLGSMPDNESVTKRGFRSLLRITTTPASLSINNIYNETNAYELSYNEANYRPSRLYEDTSATTDRAAISKPHLITTFLTNNLLPDAVSVYGINLVDGPEAVRLFKFTAVTIAMICATYVCVRRIVSQLF